MQLSWALLTCLWWGQGGTFHPVPREKPPSWGTAMDRQTLAFVLLHLYYARHQWIEREKKENNSLQLPGSHFIAVANLPSLGSNGKVLSKIKPLDRASGTQSDLLMFSFPCMQWMYGMWGVCVCVCTSMSCAQLNVPIVCRSMGLWLLWT